MKTMSGILVFFLFLGCSEVYKPQFSKAFDYGVVYGTDNRCDDDYQEILNQNPELLPEEAEMLLEMQKSTAGMVELGKHVKKNSDGSISPVKDLLTLRDRKNLCEGEKFGDQYTLPICSGFLVGPDLLVTAGHCVNKEDFKNRVWIFGYNKEYAYNPTPVFSKDIVYYTKEVLLWEKNALTKKDFAVVRLDRKVIGVKTLKIRNTGKIETGNSLVIIGHPSGLPTKISAGAKVLDASEETVIKTNLDSFGGNSGSAVINLDTGKVEGILVSGAADYVADENGEDYCQRVSSRKEDEGEEFITRISLIASAVL
jgi:V8-like Glu-specific endopeptidase